MRAFTDIISVPPIGFFIGTALTQSNGRFETLQITGCTFCCKFKEMAAIAQVSVLTATRLKMYVKFQIIIEEPNVNSNNVMSKTNIKMIK